MLIGQYKAVITLKGRLAIPARFRHELGNILVVARWLEGCLVGVTEQGLNAILKDLIGNHEISSLPVREIERFILGSAFEAELDAQGRFVLPQILKDYAGFKNDVVFIGLGNRFEIWAGENWNKKQKLLLQDSGKIVERMTRGEMKF